MGTLGDPSVLTFAAAALLWVVVAWVPGTLVLSALAPRLPLLSRFAVGPLVSIGIGFGAASWVDRVRPGLASHVVVLALLVASAASTVVLVRRRPAAAPRARRALADRANQVVVAATGAAVLQWVIAVALSGPGFAAVPPYSDGNAHGARVARMLATGSADPFVVNAFDLASPTSPSEFYPLGLHALAAQVARVAGGGSSLLVALTLVPSVLLCLGSAGLGRLVGGRRTAAAAAVAAAVLLPFATYGQMWWSPVPFLVAMASVPGLALVSLAARDARGVVAASLAWAGMLGLHLSEVLVAGVLVVLTLLLAPGPVRTRLRSLLMPAAAMAGGLLVAAPTVVGILSKDGMAPQDPSLRLDPLAAILDELAHPYLLLPGAPAAAEAVILVVAFSLVVVAAVGCWVAWRRGAGRALVLTYAGVALLGAAAYLTEPGLLGVPWYSNGDRITSQAAGLLPVLLGTGILAVARAASAHRVRRTAAVVAAVLGVGVLLVQTVVAVSTSLTSYAVVTPDDRAVFAWLATHADPGRRMLNDNRDGSPWMYSATGGAAAPVFAIKPGELFVGNPDFAGRIYLRDTIARIASDPLTRQLARQWDIQYVVIGAQTYPDTPPMIGVGEDPPGLRLVFRSGDARVYDLDPQVR